MTRRPKIITTTSIVKALSLSLAFAAVVGCQRAAAPGVVTATSAPAEIVGGSIVQPESYFSKKVVLIKIIQVTVTQDGNVTYTKSTGSRCTGTFIDRQTVLTAAHCMIGFDFNTVSVAIETDDAHVLFETPAKHFVVNALFKNGSHDVDNDIAMIKTDVALPPEFSPVELATVTPAPQTSVGAVGFGLDTYSQDEASQLRATPVLRFVGLETSQPGPGNLNSKKAITVDASPAVGMSFGDSGGPLFVYENGVLKQLGIASNMVAHDDTKVVFADAYLSIPASMDWINKTKLELLSQ